MTAAGFRKLALALPGAAEGSHHGVADFRVANKIFATLAYEKDGCGVLLLTPGEQEGMVADAPEIFSPVPNAWGRQGATLVKLAAVKPDILEAALRTAWRRRAPKAPTKP
ncbi:MAG: MmcQ/YjbR family DNA-binding protein [Bryobacterales bacterium]|nr:MmcQ/YjbR family DNA-binding protein [Bryobacterales bacterium]